MKNKILMEAWKSASEQYNHGKAQKLRHRKGGGAIADFVCFHCPLVASTEAKSLCNNNDLLDFL